jgi:hypothetical protein
MTHVHRFLQVEMFGQCSQIIGVAQKGEDAK